MRLFFQLLLIFKIVCEKICQISICHLCSIVLRFSHSFDFEILIYYFLYKVWEQCIEVFANYMKQKVYRKFKVDLYLTPSCNTVYSIPNLMKQTYLTNQDTEHFLTLGRNKLYNSE